MKTLDETLIKQIQEDYSNMNIPVKEILKKYDITLYWLYKIIGDNRRNSSKIIKNKQDINLQTAIEEYRNTKIPIDEICKKYQISKSRLLNNCKDFRRGDANKGRKYSLNEKKIIIDSREKFYWLGFISADGCINDNRTLTIELKSIDRAHLQKFCTFLETDKPIKDRINNQNVQCSRICINSINIVKYLQQYNIVPRKSLIFTIPVDKIPDYYMMDYIRGLIDGDGCIRINNHQQISLSFCSGNKIVCEQFKKILGIENKITKDNNSNTWHLQVTGNIKAKKILDKIYKHSSEKTRLDRKYNIYKTIN